MNKALRILGVKVSGVAVTDEEMDDGIEALNDMMTEMAAKGLNLGYSKVSESTDTVTSPDWANQAIKFNLALMLASEFERSVSPEAASIARQSFDYVVARAQGLGEVFFPDTLPVGAGNALYGDVDRYSYRFFPDRTKNDLLYANGDIMADQRGRVVDNTCDTED
ncbi:MAG: hypothetical protein GY799_16065 [Desulfobulbaceae bacterium]|nr:hypothetical protein [Desulfobulbaceae bacterium]